MSNEETKRTELVEEWAALHSLGALDGEEAEQLERCLGCPASPLPAALLGHQDTVCALAASVPQEAPSGDLRSRILESVEPGSPLTEADDSAETEGFLVRRSEEGTWRPLPFTGARIKRLSSPDPAPFVTLMLELAPGARLPGHFHARCEHAYLLTGEAESGGDHFAAGDFIEVPAGGSHAEFCSPSGCTAIVMTASENYTAPALAYGVLHRSFRKLGNLLGRKSP